MFPGREEPTRALYIPPAGCQILFCVSEEIKIHCKFDRLEPVENLKPHPQNPNKHPHRQIELLAKAIQHQGWRAPVVVSRRSGFVIVGHGRLEAARLIGCPCVPVDDQEFASDEDEWAHMVADNALAEWSSFDQSLLASALKGFGAEAGEWAALSSDDVEQLLALEVHGEAITFENDVTDKVRREKTAFIVPVALTRREWGLWELVKVKLGEKNCRKAFLKLLATAT